MRFPHAPGLTLALCVLALPTWAQKSKAKPITRDEAEYNALLKGCGSAMTPFYKRFEKLMTDKEIEKLQSDKAKNPAYLYLPRFQALARRASRSEIGAKSLLEMMRLFLPPKDAQTVAATAADSLIAEYRDSPVIAEAAKQIGYINWQSDTAKPIRLLKNMSARCPGRNNKASAMFGLACLYADGGHETTAAQKAEAKALFAQLNTDYADTPYAKRAASYIFQLDNLQVGMTAPDFEATDETGQNFKLSDYRGKVVVVDFWGFW